MECEVARDALSARIDGEREPVPAARVDEHLAQCADCRTWLDGVTVQAASLRRMAQRPVALPPIAHARVGVPSRLRSSWRRWALLGVGVVQIAVGSVQALGLSVGLSHDHGMGSGGHLLNESTAWTITLGVVMVGAAVWPSAAAGLAGVLSVFVGVLTAYVVADAMSGAVTAARVLTHLPVVVGAVLAILVWRHSTSPRPEAHVGEPQAEIVLPDNASRGRRRGHLWPTDGSAA
ncbi:MAG: zf-HC2 domain-containing protein [Mycobacterium sp.]